jgi:hypothetical protein
MEDSKKGNAYATTQFLKMEESFVWERKMKWPNAPCCLALQVTYKIKT